MEIRITKDKNLKMHQIVDDAQLIIGEGFKALKIDNEYLHFYQKLAF